MKGQDYNSGSYFETSKVTRFFGNTKCHFVVKIRYYQQMYLAMTLERWPLNVICEKLRITYIPEWNNFVKLSSIHKWFLRSVSGLNYNNKCFTYSLVIAIICINSRWERLNFRENSNRTIDAYIVSLASIPTENKPNKSKTLFR